MQVKKEKPLGFSYTRRGVRKNLLVFFISVFYAHFFVYSVQTLGQRNNLRDFIFKHII